MHLFKAQCVLTRLANCDEANERKTINNVDALNLDESHADADMELVDGMHDRKKELEKRGADELSAYYVVRSVPPAESPDPHSRLQIELFALSNNMHCKPNLPADPRNPTHSLTAAHMKHCGAQLPDTHCAFDQCAWLGSCDAELMLHWKHLTLTICN